MKQNFKLSIAITATLSVALLTMAEAQDSTFQSKLFFGGKSIDSAAWSAQDGHGSIGLLSDFSTGFYGLRIAVDLLGSGSEEVTESHVKGTYTAEAQLGLRRYFDLNSQISLYMGGGVNFAYATQGNVEGSERIDEEDMDIGVWMNGGVDFAFTDHVTAGLDLRYVTADVTLFKQPVELNALTTGLTLGYRW